MKKKVSTLKIVSFFAFILTIASFNVLVYLSMRPFWYFINRDTKTPIFTKLPFTSLVFCIYVLFFVYALVLFLIFLNKRESFISTPSKKNIIAPSLLSFILLGFTIYLYTQMKGANYLVINYLKSVNPYLFIIILLIILIFTNFNTKYGKSPIFYDASIIIVLGFMLLNAINFGNVEITSGPNMQLIDNNNIAIIWTTDYNSTSFVEYGPDVHNLKVAHASTDGLIDANTTTHKVVIPNPKGSTMVYRVISRKINRYYQNNVEYGNTVRSPFKNYKDVNSNNKLVFYTFNDVHENIALYKQFLNKDDYDFLVLNGDTVNSLDKTSDIVDKILKPLSIVTKGEKPYYFVRGNHESRGGAARELPNYLALPDNHYYYTFNIGSVFGIVLDSSEDKQDDNIEYSGLADFENYRPEETKWLQAVYESSVYKNAKYKIAFVHIPLNTYANDAADSSLKNYQRDWRELLAKMKIDVVFSGHTHVPEIIKPDNKLFNYPTIIGGGPTDDQKSYVAVKTELTPQEMKIFFVNYNGSDKEVYSIQK